MTSGHYRRVAIRWMVLFAVGAILASCVPADQDLIPGLWELSETPAAGSSQADAKNISASNAGAGGEDAEIHGAVWNDLNADGIRDVAEPGLVGWTVFLDDDNDGTFDAGETSVVTDANGDYALTGLRHGTCVVVEVVQAGWQQTFPGAPGTHTVDLSPHQIVTGIDFGNKALPGEIHGLKFSDLDGDGVQDAGEPGLEGWTIFLDTDNDGVLDAGEESTVTDVDGTYSFVDLAVGNYTVAEVAASGWIQTFPTGNGRHDVTIGPGQVVSGIKFGNQVLLFTDIGAALSGVYLSSLCWGDHDNDGDLDLLIAGDSTGSITTTVYVNNGDGVFVTGASLRGVCFCSVSWGDYDNDGDLDLALAGDPGGSSRISKIYRNDGHAIFTDIGASLTAVRACSVSWGDYDNDGDLDLALTGYHQSSSSSATVTKIYRNDGGVFTDIGAGLRGEAGSGCLSWADYDNDGDLDLAVSGGVTRLYRNDGNGTFTDIGANLAGLRYSFLSWGDYDNDGDLDLALAGFNEPGITASKIYRNDGDGVFTDIGAPLVAVRFCSLSWGDCDNDGDLDLALSGSGTTKIYRNDGSNVFTDIGADLLGLNYCSLSWGDYDNDGKLDLGVSGTGDGGRISKILRNMFAADNSVPESPGELLATADGTSVTFGWNPGSDAETPVLGLSYNLRVGTSPGGCDIFSPMADSTSGYRRLPAIGNAQKRLSWTLQGLHPGTYYWSVQAIDTSYAGSAWPAEQTIVVPDPPAEIHGTKFNDLDGDGVRDGGESGLEGWTIYIDLNTNGQLDQDEPSDQTDANGNYALTGLDGGTYTVAEVMQDGWGQTFPSGGTHTIPVDPGDTVVGIDFGNGRLGEIRGVKWNDQDGDGAKDEGEPGLEGWTIYADLNTNGQLDQDEPSDQTGADGSYALTDLAPGTYSVAEVMQAEWAQTFPANGSHAVTMNAGQVIADIDFGNQQFGEIRGMKFNDLDGDGVRDDGEPGLEGWTIWVDLDGDGWYYPDGEPSAVTDSNGQYAITGIAPGTYTVTEVGQIGWCATFPAGGTHSVTIGPGEVVENIHFGNQLWFAYIGTPLPGPDYGGSLNWGDYDSDGDLDLVITGLPYGDSSADVFRNDGDDVFTPIQTGLWGDAMSAWGDCDNDGDLDLAIGDPDGNQVYRNDGSGVFSNIGAPWLPWALWIAWGDYDNDGDLDFGVGSTRWGNRIYRNDGNDLFTDSGINLPDSYGSGFSWGDYDNDGDLDLAIYGVWIDPPGACVTKVYRNEGGGVFAETGIALSDSYPYCPPPQWGDYDNDGDLDLADVSYAGGEQGLVTKIYRNDGSDTFTDIGVELPGGRCLWGDCDGDGDLDLVIAGIEGISANYSEISVCRNDGGDVFTDMDLYIWSFPEGYEIALGDYDNDGRLDLAAFVIWDGVVTKVLRNVIAVPNSIPSAPGGLSATVDGTSVTFSWSAASDVETPAPGLSYNLRVGTSSGGCDIFSPMADATSGYRRLPAIGNAQKRLSWTLKGLAPGRYYWSVQAIDTSYAGSAWAPEQTVFVGSALIIASAPGDQESLWRSQNNIIRLMFDGGITVPTPGDVLIQEMLDGGAYGPDLSSNFSYTLEHAGGALPMILKIQEDGSVLTHRKWYAVRNVGGWAGVADFMVQYVVQVGDANNDGRVLNTDVGAINEMIPTFDAVDDDRRDINGDGRVLNTDVGAANGNIPSFPVPKPDGH